jgi:hypothetical protein
LTVFVKATAAKVHLSYFELSYSYHLVNDLSFRLHK